LSTSTTAGTDVAQLERMAMHRARKRLNAVTLTLSVAAMAFGLFWLLWILFETFRLGVGGLALSVFTESTPPPQAAVGGLANAIFGSLLIVSLATLLGTPIGVLAGVYIAEYGQRNWLGRTTHFINDILLSAPACSSTPSSSRGSRASRDWRACSHWR
jgi:phosphate transport system permease protein